MTDSTGVADEDIDEHSGDSIATADAGGWRHLIEHIQDAVVEFEFVNGEPIVRDVNESFVEVFGYDREIIVGASLNEYIVPEWLAEEAAGLDDRTASGEINYGRVTRQTGSGLREFLYRAVPDENAERPRDGFAVYTDLGDITRKERQLQVLNRVLRHNLRNSLTVIAGNTDWLLDRLEDPEYRRITRDIKGATEDLRDLAAEAATINDLLEAGAVEDPSIDCVPLVAGVAEEFREAHPDATIETEAPETAPVGATRKLRTAIRSLVQNAIEHNPATTPLVRLRVERTGGGGWVHLFVEDDGPLIPAEERNVVTGEAEITPTRHGSGLGLWLVKWTTDRFGGDMSFGESDLGGNSVRLRLQTSDSD